ncbi:MAG: TetR/AcrR family transcriptional regulator [Propionibacteriaceae bacterium]|jgi:AcrR family transcriptional regulator|nr:TetR/AcrR family transcriptional regulator [Propionibacteriaceae bacterium]
MPRVSPAYRQARRDLIARAAIACIERRGVHETSIADIVAESGLSTGAIYSHFTDKAELVRYIFSYYLLPRLDQLRIQSDAVPEDESTPARVVATPGHMLHRMLQMLNSTGLPYVIFAQFWAEVTVDPELREAFHESVGLLQTTVSQLLLPWAEQRACGGSDHSDSAEFDEHAVELAQVTTRALVSILQGYVVNAALFGDPASPDDYIKAVSTAFGAGPDLS